jgi:hypothetical protein
MVLVMEKNSRCFFAAGGASTSLAAKNPGEQNQRWAWDKTVLVSMPAKKSRRGLRRPGALCSRPGGQTQTGLSAVNNTPLQSIISRDVLYF